MRLFILYCFFSTVLTAYSQAGMDTAQASNCFSKAELFFSKSNHDSSIYYFEKASRIYQRAFKNMANTSSYKVLVQKHITCLNKVAENYYRLQKLEQALQTSEEALKSSK